jgi:hypothetical protein
MEERKPAHGKLSHLWDLSRQRSRVRESSRRLLFADRPLRRSVCFRELLFRLEWRRRNGLVLFSRPSENQNHPALSHLDRSPRYHLSGKG